VGIVGTRRVTPQGVWAAREVATALAGSGAVVVSGLAQGIDSAAHEAALRVEGLTVAVIGEGLRAFEQFVPLRRRPLADRIRREGAIVSEWALDRAAHDWMYPRRNATIAALSDVLVVIEAPVGSGALITADRAREIGLPVYAVPGPFGAATWAGSNALIKTGAARMLVDAAEVADALGLTVAPVGLTPSGAGARLLEVLATGAADADTIAAALDIDPSAVPSVIAEQLLLGTVVATGDGRFARR
jgi:DNA processing protein